MYDKAQAEVADEAAVNERFEKALALVKEKFDAEEVSELEGKFEDLDSIEELGVKVDFIEAVTVAWRARKKEA